MTDIGTRHGFLAALHEVLRPKTYLEVGVQYGVSLALAHAAELAIGIDPNPLTAPVGNQQIMTQTSDEWFGMQGVSTRLSIDLAFIDGMHLAEYALRDFANIEQYCHPGSAIVFDDVLPRNQHEARRIEPGGLVVGNWTGDVWKVRSVLAMRERAAALAVQGVGNAPGSSLTLRLVNTEPTGLLVVTGFTKPPTPDWVDKLDWLTDPTPAPDAVIDRVGALSPQDALSQIRQELGV